MRELRSLRALEVVREKTFVSTKDQALACRAAVILESRHRNRRFVVQPNGGVYHVVGRLI